MYSHLGNLVKAYATYFRQGFNLFNETETYMKTLDDKIQVFPEGSGPVYGKMFLVTIISKNPKICLISEHTCFFSAYLYKWHNKAYRH